MPRFSANLSMLFTEHDFLDRFDAAARAGFKAVEYVGPYDHAPEVVAARLKKNGLSQVLFNLPPGDWGKGERGIAVLSDRIDEFRKSVDTAITYAKALDCPQVNCLAGIAPEGASYAELEDLFVHNLSFAAKKLEEAGIKLLVEAINTRDIPGFFLNTSRQALAILRPEPWLTDIGRPNGSVIAAKASDSLAGSRPLISAPVRAPPDRELD